jgi:hypothetical protein
MGVNRNIFDRKIQIKNGSLPRQLQLPDNAKVIQANRRWTLSGNQRRPALIVRVQ